MNPIRRRRLFFIIFFIFGLGVATSFILYALKKNINVFITPSQVMTEHMPRNYTFRLGGLVKKGSLIHQKESLDVSFVVTDLKHELKVRYTGVLPDLFREGKGAIVEGHIDDQNEFRASQVLAKHDENYMPKNVDQTLKKNSKATKFV